MNSYIKVQISIYISIVLFSFILITTNAMAQPTGFLYSNEISKGSTIYIISNHDTTMINNEVYSNYELSKDSIPYFFKGEFITADSIHYTLMDSSQFINEISAIEDDWLLFIHGAGKTFNNAVHRGYDVQHYQKVNVIVFSWPSRNPNISPGENLKTMRPNVSKSMVHYKYILSLMRTFRKENKGFETHSLSAIYHSIGNQYPKNLALEDSAFANQEPIFKYSIINAAAVEEKNHTQWVENFNLQERIIINSNINDVNLNGIRIFTKESYQLGETAFYPLAKNATYINFSDIVKFTLPPGAAHTYFIGKSPAKYPSVYDFYYDIFHGISSNFTQIPYIKKRADGDVYDFLKDQ
ncbi:MULTISPECIES: alpha/beta hydrolase [unclassified Lentimicrobium]|uniref:alpha/beta hydrolase n=1 Tax=unclassified Lentimicrobium TaxID=2677434 RepID=UPI0015527460|nr:MULTISPECIES: alpha/beta hydrolase [unclassified Lentimicrobium]NPD44624.1 alpha/beta hydrolase [Lentimicrobium sp. S6]NPD83336.1 alpha/beta hydrolase [Lentimicrobium sp. L6]